MLEKGWSKKWSLFQYYVFIHPSILFILDKIDDTHPNENKTFLDFLEKNTSIVVQALLAATASAILIEKKNSIQAVYKSISLCGSNIILSFMTNSCHLMLKRFMFHMFFEHTIDEIEHLSDEDFFLLKSIILGTVFESLDRM